MRKDSPVNLPCPGRRTKKLAKAALVSCLILLTVLGSIGPQIPSIVSALFGSPASAASSGQSAVGASQPPAGSITPNFVGANPVPDLSLPKTVLSSVQKLIGAGGVIQTSQDNLTLYNSVLALRLLGGFYPHDELLGPDRRAASSHSFWGVEIQNGSSWLPMIPKSSSFSLLGTNETGTFVQRTMNVSSGRDVGTLAITYKATSKGPIKWNLGFVAGGYARYRLVYAWWNVTDNYTLLSASKQFRVSYRNANFTFSWSDVPTLYNVTWRKQPDRFLLEILLGSLSSGASVLIDPSIVASGVAAGGTAYGFQRRVFYEPSGGNYWIFYNNGTTVAYRHSSNGVSWSNPNTIPGWPDWTTPEESSAAVFNTGRYVVVATGQGAHGTLAPGTIIPLRVFYTLGTISAGTISWQSVQTAFTINDTCDVAPQCQFNAGFAFVNVAISSDGTVALSYNWRDLKQTSTCPSVSGSDLWSSNSTLFLQYKSGPYRVTSSANCDHGILGMGAYSSDGHPSALIPADSGDGMQAFYQHNYTRTLGAMRFNGTGFGIAETVSQNLAQDVSAFSTVSDANYGAHVVYRTVAGSLTKVSYSYRAPCCSSWTRSTDILPGTASEVTITADYSTNDVYVFALNGTSIVMKSKAITGSWVDNSISFPVVGRTNPKYLGSNYASVSNSAAAGLSQLLIVWTEGTSPYNAMFASIPIQTVWSPYSSPSDPWDGNGLAPYGQYFTNLGESVSPRTGMLTVRQTDLGVPGRGLSFEVTRVYEEPYSFLSTGPFQYESYPWAPMGNGWQLNFPWFKNVAPSRPTYIHLWDAQGYRVPYNFWNGTTTVFENHQGEHFRLVRNSTGIFLYTKSGVSYVFDPSYKLLKVLDQTGNNSITFAYDGSNHISTVADSAGRVFLFCYSGGLVQTIYQTSGTCASPGTARRVLYGYGGGSLTSVTDLGGRVTSYVYSAVGNASIAPWLLSRVTYPTQWYSNYTYAPRVMGTQASSYRVIRQLVSSTTSAVRRFDYVYSQLSGGDSVSNSTVTTYDGASGSLSVAGYTRYSYSFAGVTMNISDAYNRLVRGTQQRFGVNGEIPREIALVTALNTWYWTKTSPGTGWSSQRNWIQDSTWSIAPAVANETQPSPPWGPITGWQDTAAKWIWWNPTAATSSTTEPVWFRTLFTVVKAGTFNVNVTADDSFTLYIDGYKIQSGTSWSTNYSNSTYLDARDHVIGVSATNTGGPAGFLLSIKDAASSQVIVRTDTSLGSYSNYYRYDLWGNLIYARKSINPSANWAHESFNTYYNTGLPPAFNAFQDSFSQGNYTRPDEPWTVNNGTWTGQSGVAFKDATFSAGWTQVTVGNFTVVSEGSDGDLLTITGTPRSNGDDYRTWIRSGLSIDTSLFPYLVVRWKTSAGSCTGLGVGIVAYYSDSTNRIVQPTDCTAFSTSWTTIAYSMNTGKTLTKIELYANDNPNSLASGTYSVYYDYLMVANEVPARQDDGLGQYTGAIGKGAQQATFAWSDLGVSDLSFRASIFLTRLVNSTDSRVGLIAHYPGTGTGKWALVVHNASGTVKLSLLDEWVAWKAETPCSGITTKNWYALNFTMRGTQTRGTITGPGVNCTVTASFSGSSLSSATGFGLYSGGYSAIFDNVTVATVFPYLTGTGFSNSFYNNGLPNSNTHGAIAGTAELSNSTGTVQLIESYASYSAWGGLSQMKQRYDSPTGVQWPSTSYNYDIYGNPSKFTDARGNYTTYAYSSSYQNAYLTSKTRLDGSTSITTSYAYNFTTGNIQSTTDPMNNVTSFKNDNLGRVTRIIYPLSAYINYTYNDSANYADIINENKTRTRQIYDGLARLRFVDRFLNGVSYSNETYSYTWQDKILTKTDPLGNVYRFGYDVLGRTVNATKPNGKSTLQFYNDLASWDRSADEDGNYKCTIYDRLGRLVSVVEKATADCQTGIVTNYYFNEVGNLGKVTNSLSKSISHNYDNLGRLTRTTHPDNFYETFTYDNNGNIVSSTDRGGVKTMRSYDSLNRLKTVTYCGTPSITPIIGTSYIYDKNGNPLQIKNENSTVTYIYDARNRVLNETSAVNLANRQLVDLGCFGPGGTLTRNGGVSKTYTVGFTYKGEYLDTLMYPTISQSNPDITIKYSYDTLGRVLNVTRLGTSTYYARSFTYYKNGQVKGLQFGNGLIGNYTYDNLSRPLNVTLKNGGTTMISLMYVYNYTGTVKSVLGTINAVTVNEQYRYDAFQRLTNYTVTSSGSTTSGWYEYDNVGNRVRQRLNLTITAYSYNSLNQLTNSTANTTPQTKINYGYDLNGNLKTQNVTTVGTVRWTYTWDAANRLLKATNGTGQALYAYDGMGRMVETVEGSSTWFLAYKGTEVLYRNLLNQNNQAYVFATGMKIVRVVDRTATYYYHTDALGSTRMITYNDATYVFIDNYQPFGKDNGTPKGSLANTEKDRFTGKPYSASSQLQYNYQRWYDPNIGRFLSVDPLGGKLSDPQALNPYVYVSNRPSTLTDPSGLVAFFAPFKWEDPFGLPPIFAQMFTTGGPYGAAAALGVYGIYIGGSLIIGALTPKPALPITPASTSDPAPPTTPRPTVPTPPGPTSTIPSGLGTIPTTTRRPDVPPDLRDPEKIGWPPGYGPTWEPLGYDTEKSKGNKLNVANAVCAGVLGVGVLLFVASLTESTKENQQGVSSEIQLLQQSGEAGIVLGATCLGLLGAVS